MLANIQQGHSSYSQAASCWPTLAVSTAKDVTANNVINDELAALKEANLNTSMFKEGGVLNDINKQRKHAVDSRLIRFESVDSMNDNSAGVAGLSQSQDDDAEGEFQDFESRKMRMKKRRIEASQKCAQTVGQVDVTFFAAKPYNDTGESKPMLGKSMDSRLSIKASRSLFKKAVFYVGNISKDCSADDIMEFVKNLGVTCYSCYQVKKKISVVPSKPIKHSKSFVEPVAFKVCIKEDDIQIFENLDNWADSILIRRWEFKAKPVKDNNMKSLDDGTVNTRNVTGLSGDMVGSMVSNTGISSQMGGTVSGDSQIIQDGD